jgi:tetratricopeptide (TPR) repeat protein
MTFRLFLLAVLVAVAPRPSSAKSYWADVAGAKNPEREGFIKTGNEKLSSARNAKRQWFEANQTAVRSPSWRLSPEPVKILDEARLAITWYEKAIAIEDSADLRYHAVTAATYIAAPDGYQALVRHVNGLRRLDPMDPRERELSNLMSHALSKLGAMGGPDGEAALEQAIREYELWRGLVDESNTDVAELAISYSNAAELLMAVGRLDESIAYYRRSIELNASEPLNHYGAAVAYDREGQWLRATAELKDALRLDPNLERLDSSGVFFVPDGDKSYYLALIHQVRGHKDLAIDNYRRFLRTAAAKRYGFRAREHLAELGATP